MNASRKHVLQALAGDSRIEWSADDGKAVIIGPGDQPAGHCQRRTIEALQTLGFVEVTVDRTKRRAQLTPAGLRLARSFAARKRKR